MCSEGALHYATHSDRGQKNIPCSSVKHRPSKGQHYTNRPVISSPHCHLVVGPRVSWASELSHLEEESIEGFEDFASFYTTSFSQHQTCSYNHSYKLHTGLIQCWMPFDRFSVRMKKENLGVTDQVILEEEEEDRPQSHQPLALLLNYSPSYLNVIKSQLSQLSKSCNYNSFLTRLKPNQQSYQILSNRGWKIQMIKGRRRR